MLNSVKHNLKTKATKCIEDGTTTIHHEINNVKESINNIDQRISHTVANLQQEIHDLKQELPNKQFVSPEYILDTIKSNDSKKPRLLICGYYGARNLGDELMLQAILKRIDSTKFDITILLANHIEVDASIYAPYHVIHYPQYNDDILILAMNYDYIIWGGGAIIDDSWYSFYYSHSSLGYILLKTSLAALKSNKKVFVLGTSTNQTLEDSNFIRDLQTIILKANFFSLRDTNSLKTLQDSQIDIKKVNIIDDIAISDLPTSLPKKQSKNLNIGLVFIFDDKNLKNITSFVKLITIYFSDKPVTLSFIPFFDHCNYDQKRFQEILSSINAPKNISINIKPFANTMDELIQIFSQCDCIFSMRYHATLISSLCGIKTLSIDYGGEHRHYRNKLSYIKKHYNDFEVIPSSSITDKKLVFNAIEQTLTQTTHKINTQAIKSANKTLSEIITLIN